MIYSIIYGSVVGLSLGLTGGGGSIFAVPLLVYGLHVGLRRAVAISLAVVGLTALYGAALQARGGRVLWGAGVALGCGGIAAAPLGAWFGARLPEKAGLIAFAALMVFIGIRMLRNGNQAAEVPMSWITCRREPEGKPRFHWRCALKLVAAGALTGILSGIFGVGGGFLVVPALLVVAGLDIDQALATSLVGIFLIAASGFAANSAELVSSDIPLALWFLGGAGVGMTLGAAAKTKISGARLRQFFAVSVLCVAGYVALRSLQA